MHTVFIKFLTQDDRARGFYELATKASIGSFPGEIYQGPVEGLELLDSQMVAYRRSTDVAVKAALDRVQIRGAKSDDESTRGFLAGASGW